MASVVLHVRIPEAVETQLEDYAREQGISKSAAARALLVTALTDDPRLAALEGAMMEFHRAVKAATGKLTARYAQELPDMIYDEMHQG